MLQGLGSALTSVGLLNLSGAELQPERLREAAIDCTSQVPLALTQRCSAGPARKDISAEDGKHAEPEQYLSHLFLPLLGDC